MSVLATLENARARILPPERFARQAFARDATDRAVNPESDRAVCWCLVAALELAAPDKHAGADAKNALLPLLPQRAPHLTTFSDTSTHAEVIALLDLGIANERARLAKVSTR